MEDLNPSIPNDFHIYLSQENGDKSVAKILFIVSNDIYVRNYLRSDALHEIDNRHEVFIFADEHLALLSELQESENFAGTFSYAPKISQRHHLLFSILMWRYRKRSRTFLYRWMRLSQWGMVEKQSGAIRFGISFLKWALAGLRNQDALIPPILGSKFLFALSSWFLKRNLPINEDLEVIVNEVKPDLIVFPSAAYEPVGIDAIRLGKHSGIPTLSLIDNWDNLISKTVYWVKPDHLSVWGQQAKEQALLIHGFDPSSVHLLGTPRFEQYFQARKEKHEYSHQAPYLLFVGSAMPFDEIGALHAIEAILAGQKRTPSEIRIIYRPHPWQQKRKVNAVFQSKDFLFTDLDPQISDAYSRGLQPEKTDASFQPDLDYYPNLLRQAQLVLGPLTTMLFEAVLCLRPVVALAYFDGIHYTTTQRYFSHFDGLEKAPGFAFCEDPDELETMILDAIISEPIDAGKSDEISSHYLHRDDVPYSKRLANLIDSLC